MATPSLTHAWRMLCWGRLLARHGCLRFLERHSAVPLSLRLMARLARLGSSSQPPHYAAAFEALGPAAIKLGQALATRPDLIGTSAAQDLARLQDRLPPFPFADFERCIETEFGAPWQRLYAHIDPIAVGAASVAQVHRAKTHEGHDVAIKVLRPGIEARMRSAIETYAWAASWLERLGGEAARLRPRLVIETFRQWVNRELDLRLEAASASELAETMRDDPAYHVPAVDWQRTSKRVLTIGWIEGLRLTDLAALDAAGIDRPALARVLVLRFLKQAIEDGVFHADLHPGNVFVDLSQRLCVIDFGIMGRVGPLARRYLAEILHGLLTRNYHRVAAIHFEAGYVPPHHNIQDFACALRAVGEPILGRPIKDISPGRLLDQLFAITRSFDMETQPHLLLLQKTMVMVEGLALHLDPNANMWEISAPYLEHWIRSELGPEARLADGLRRFVHDVGALPDVLRRIAQHVPRKGAAPPPIPLPPLPASSPKRLLWACAAALGLGVMVGHWFL